MSNTRIIALALSIAMTTSGCSMLDVKKPEDYPLVPALSQKEVVDYYSESLSFDTIVTKNLEKDEVNYVTKDVSDEKRAQLESLLNKAQGILGQAVYPEDTEETKAIVSPETFYYMKTALDDKVLSGGTAISFKEALGYYFIDVTYTVGGMTPGAFTDRVNYLGINGAFRQDAYGVDYIDNAFMTKAVSNINEYYVTNKMAKSLEFDKDTTTLKVNNTSAGIPFNDTAVADESSSSSMADTEIASSEEASSDATSSDAASSTVETVDESPLIGKGTEITARALPFDLKLFNKISGSSTSQTAYMPKLDIVYSIPEVKGQLSGYGIYPAGDDGLKAFGYSRDQIAGTATIRYVFKDDIMNPRNIVGEAVYPVSMELTNSISAVGDVMVPEFVKVEISKLIERSDRAILNCDMTALMSGDIYSDIGKAVLTGFERQHSYVMRNISTLRRVVARDDINKTYVVEVESLRQEGPVEGESYGTYTDSYIVSIAQRGTQFIITDSALTSRILAKEPQIGKDSTIVKRMVALNLAGEITTEQQASITLMLNNLYNASTLRVLNGPKTIKDANGADLTVEYGMYDCFNSDTNLLSSDRKEYLNSLIREQLVKHGVDITATYSGLVTEWMGGADRQAEFTTEEIITYNGFGDAYYMQVYYLASNMQDRWVIDEMNILESRVITDEAEINTIKTRITG